MGTPGKVIKRSRPNTWPRLAAAAVRPDPEWVNATSSSPLKVAWFTLGGFVGVTTPLHWGYLSR